jgi:hypothetical protein
MSEPILKKMMIITKILLEISVKIWNMLANIVDILCVNFKPNRKGTPFRIMHNVVYNISDLKLRLY